MHKSAFVILIQNIMNVKQSGHFKIWLLKKLKFIQISREHARKSNIVVFRKGHKSKGHSKLYKRIKTGIKLKESKIKSQTLKTGCTLPLVL